MGFLLAGHRRGLVSLWEPGGAGERRQAMAPADPASGSGRCVNRRWLRTRTLIPSGADPVICVDDVAHPVAWRDDGLVLDVVARPGSWFSASTTSTFRSPSSRLSQDPSDRAMRHRSAAGADAQNRCGRCQGVAVSLGGHLALDGGADRRARQRLGRTRRLRPRGADVTCSSLPGNARKRASPRYGWICRSGWGARSS